MLRVHTADKDYISKCYTNENKAIDSCPTAAMLKDPAKNTEYILFSKLRFGLLLFISSVFSHPYSFLHISVNFLPSF